MSEINLLHFVPVFPALTKDNYAGNSMDARFDVLWLECRRSCKFDHALRIIVAVSIVKAVINRVGLTSCEPQ